MRFFIIILGLLLYGCAFSQQVIEEPTEQKEKGLYNSNQSNAPVQNNMNTIPVESEELQEVAPSKKQEKTASKSATSVQTSAERFTHYETQSGYMRTQRSPSVQQQEQMDDAVRQLEKLDPKSFEYHYFKYVSGNYNIDWIDHLKSAEKLRPNNADVQTQMAAYHLITGNDQQALSYLQKLVNSGKLSADAIDYSRDLMRSVPAGGVLVTHGFDDMYACSYVQLKEELRSDVTIVSLDFLQSGEYRKKLRSAGLKIPDDKNVGVAFLETFCTFNEGKNVAISLTTPKEYLEPMMSRLYVVGLVFEYHSVFYSNVYMNDYLWNKEFDKKVVEQAKTVKAKNLSANYLPMLLVLRSYYSSNGETEQSKQVDAAIDKVAVQCNKYEQVKKLKGSY